MPKTEKRGCLFCGGRPLTSAHLISSELQKLIPRSRIGMAQEDRWTPFGTEEEKRNFRSNNSSSLDIQVKRMCNPCNGSWMQRYESRINPLLSRLYHGSHESIENAMLRDIATWSLMVAFLRATTSRGEQHLDLEDPVRFREEDKMPEGYTVWLFSGEQRTDFSSRHHRVIADGIPGWYVMIWVGKLVLIVAYRSAIPLVADRTRYWANAGSLIYPFEGDLIWPPKQEISFRDALYVLTLGNRIQKAGRDSNPR